MNTWTITGTVRNFGTKGQQYKKLWINLETSCKLLTTTRIFINSDIDSTPGSKGYKVADYILSTITKDCNIAVVDATLALIKFSEQKEDKTWETKEKIGVKSSMKNIIFANPSTLQINTGFLRGKVTKQTNDKLVVEQAYQIPATKEWKVRPVPVLIGEQIYYLFKDNNLIGQNVFIGGEIATNDQTIFVHAIQMVTL